MSVYTHTSSEQSHNPHLQPRRHLEVLNKKVNIDQYLHILLGLYVLCLQDGRTHTHTRTHQRRHNSPWCCWAVIGAPQPGSCIVNGNNKICARYHLSPQQPHSSATSSGSSCSPRGPVKAFLFCHFIGNRKAISYTRDIWCTWIWTSTYSNSQWQQGFHSPMSQQNTYTLPDLCFIFQEWITGFFSGK